MSYEIEYADETTRGLCEKRRLATRKFGTTGAKKLAHRIKELESAPDEVALRQGTGGWHPIDHDWPGCLGAHLDGAATIIVECIVTTAGAKWLVKCLGDCYQH